MALTVPKFIRTAFASFGQKNEIPETTNNVTGAAGYNQGFSEINMLPEGAGGIPPDGKDFNGILFDLSSAIQYLQAGLSFPFNQDFANSIGGYPKGSLISDVSNDFLWSCVSNNNINPPSVSGWEKIYFGDPSTEIRGAPFQATQLQAETGTNNTAMMTALRVFQSIRSAASNATEILRGSVRFGTQTEVNTGASPSVAISPEKLANGVFCPVGIRQSWVDLRSSRFFNTTYTNTSNRAIQVMIALRTNTSVSSSSMQFLVNGVELFSDATASHIADYMICCIIPPSSTYRVNISSNVTLCGWSELK